MKHYLNEQEQRKVAGIVDEDLQVPFSPNFTKTYKNAERLLATLGGYLHQRGMEQLRDFRDRETAHYLDHVDTWTDQAKKGALYSAEHRLGIFYSKLKEIAAWIEQDVGMK